jgi:spore maturation protein CgeB
MASVLIVAHLAPATSDVPLLLARAFDRLGWPAEVFAMDEDLPAAERVLEPLGFAHDHRLWMALFNRRLRRHIRRTRPAILLLFGSNWKVAPETLRRARDAGVRTALWECNHWLDAWFQVESLPHYDCYFDLDSHFLPLARERGAARVEHLPGCADPDEHHPATLRDRDRERYAADVSFVGSPYPERVPFFEALGGYRLKLWGTGWDAIDTRGLSVVPAAIVREPVYGLKKTRIFCASAINVNVQGARMVNGENFRLFEIAACEGFCLTTPKPDLARWFRAGLDLETFETPAGLRARVDRLLRDPQALRQHARAARTTVLREHTYDHRAGQILDALGLRPATEAVA